MKASGVSLFARYAFPPNRLGYCGPTTTDWVGGFGGGDELESERVVRAFEGAYPYLELIGGCHGLDPLDRRVVEAYWLGNDLLDDVDTLVWGNSVDDRFRARAGWEWSTLAEGIAGGAPNHAFHVFCAYPWVGLLRDGSTDAALQVIDRCRIRWGRVIDVGDAVVVARSEPLAWDGRELTLDVPKVEAVSRPVDGPAVSVGDVVSMHWDHVCDVLTDSQVTRLRRETMRHLDIANDAPRALSTVIES
jgi:Family of unknown function (DUF6390)